MSRVLARYVENWPLMVKKKSRVAKKEGRVAIPGPFALNVLCSIGLRRSTRCGRGEAANW